MRLALFACAALAGLLAAPGRPAVAQPGAPGPHPAGLQSVCFGAADHGWAAGAAHVWHTADGGQTWTTALTSPAASGLSDEALRGFTAEVQCVGAEVAWVLLTNPGAMMQSGWALYRTEDGGQRWTPVAQSGQFFPPTGAPAGHGGWNRVWLAAVDASTAYVAGVCVACSLPGSPEQGTVSVGGTRDGGQTWHEHPPLPGLSGQALLAAPLALSFPTPERGWLVTPAAGPTLYHTADGGATWQPQHLDGGDSPGQTP